VRIMLFFFSFSFLLSLTGGILCKIEATICLHMLTLSVHWWESRESAQNRLWTSFSLYEGNQILGRKKLGRIERILLGF
jgi:hypothetical protein